MTIQEYLQEMLKSKGIHELSIYECIKDTKTNLDKLKHISIDLESDVDEIDERLLRLLEQETCITMSKELGPHHKFHHLFI